jgi:glutamyl-tRNA reductase
MELIVLGTSHETAPAEIRDRVQLSAPEIEELCARLRSQRDQVLELSVLSTCNRTEVYSLVADPAEADRMIRAAIETQKGVPYLSNGKYTYSLTGPDMVRHLFRVASGIESLMVGEPQILGQVRDALKLADHGRSAGAVLTRLFNTAVHVGKRARTETAIGRGTVSVAYAAVETTLKVFDGLHKHTVAVVGAGETGSLVARHLAAEEPARLLVLNRTPERAARLAAEVGGEARPLAALDETLAEASVVVMATSSPEPLLSADRLAAARRRKHQPLVLVDISNPRNIDPAAAGLDSVFLYDLDALVHIAEQNRERRAGEIPRVERIVEEELDAFFAWYDALQVVPVLRALRDRFHEIGREEVERASGGLSEVERETLRAYTRALINKLLHQPTTRIRGIEATTGHGVHKLVAVQELFELDLDAYGGPPGPGADPEESAAARRGERPSGAESRPSAGGGTAADNRGPDEPVDDVP